MSVPHESHLGIRQPQHILAAVPVILLNSEVAALVEHGQGFGVTVERHVEILRRARHAVYVGQLKRRHLRQHVDDGTGRRAVKPIIGNLSFIESVEQAKRIIDIGHTATEVIAVVHTL